MSRRFLSFDVLESKIALDGSVIQPPEGITSPIEASPSTADLDTATGLVPQILGDTTGLFDTPTDPNLPNLVLPSGPVVLGSYGGPMPTQEPIVLAAVPLPYWAYATYT
jgi:hypothetical protein